MLVAYPNLLNQELFTVESRCSHLQVNPPTSPVIPFLLMQNQSPKDIRSWNHEAETFAVIGVGRC